MMPRTATPTPWLTGVATIVRPDGAGVLVDCPHCGGQHRHGKGMIGSRQVLAGCHTGWSRCRMYAIADSDPHPRNNGHRRPFTDKPRSAA